MTTAEVISVVNDSSIELHPWEAAQGVGFLLEHQCSEGNWTDGDSVDPWDVSATAWAVHALKAFSTTEASSSRLRAEAWLRSMILSAGGLPTNANHQVPNTYASAYGLRALRDDPAASREQIARFLIASQNSDGGWGLKLGDPSEPTLSAYTLHGLIDGKLDSSLAAIENGLCFLESARNSKGIWGSWLAEPESVEGTAFCAYILRRGRRPWSSADTASIEYLKQRVLDGRAFDIDCVGQVWVAVSVLLLTTEIERGRDAS